MLYREDLEDYMCSGNDWELTKEKVLHKYVFDIFELPNGKVHWQIEPVLRETIQCLQGVTESCVGDITPTGIVRTDQLFALVD